MPCNGSGILMISCFSIGNQLFLKNKILLLGAKNLFLFIWSNERINVIALQN